MDRLPADDLIWIYSDDLGNPMYTGALLILDGDNLHDSRGRFRLVAVRRMIEQRLYLVPRFRQVIHRPRFGLGTPLWIDAHTFDVADHVRIRRLSVLTGDEDLLEACEELLRGELDSSKPLWEMWFILGMEAGRVALLIKVHHAIADGTRGLAILAAFVGTEPEFASPSHQAWIPARPPSNSYLLGDNVRRRLRGLRRKLSHLAHPISGLRRVRGAWPFIAEVFAARAPQTSLNRTVGRNRRMALSRGSLGSYRAIAQVRGAKINDVLLSAVAGGLRDLLSSRHELVDDLVLRAMVPVSLNSDGLARGNVTSGMVVPLPLGEADPVRRLEMIAAETAILKTKARPTLGLIFRSQLAQKALLRVFRRQRFENLYVTNVPGPPVPLSFLGTEVQEIFPIVPTGGNVTLGIGALSYAGQLNVTAVADSELCPDLHVFVKGFEQSLGALADSTLVEST
ncbi:MAG TPA: wax ester/triacylglycerol synthase family O-acyltransferase [Acidimicrobiia bacterium]|nr:wax ester/triacylglycerol synthase family O-acyltransferase [Acidimicrobiia bacterium]